MGHQYHLDRELSCCVCASPSPSHEDSSEELCLATNKREQGCSRIPKWPPEDGNGPFLPQQRPATCHTAGFAVDFAQPQATTAWFRETCTHAMQHSSPSQRLNVNRSKKQGLSHSARKYDTRNDVASLLQGTHLRSN